MVISGQSVTAGESLAVLTAMKMETAVCAPMSGIISHVAVDKNDTIEAGDLMFRIAAVETVVEA